MTKQELTQRYKEIEAKKIIDGITEVNLWKDEKRELYLHVRMLFAYGKLYYSGDMGTYVFGRDIHSITTFFKGDEINPEYWQEKVEAASRPVILEYADEEKVVSGLEKLAEENFSWLDDEKKDEIEQTVSNDLHYIRVLDAVTELLESWLIDDAGETAWSIVRGALEFGPRYLYCCEAVQWVENNLERWLSENQKSKESDKRFFIDDIDLTDNLKDNEEVKDVLSGKTRNLEEAKCYS